MLLALTCMSHARKDGVLISCNGYGALKFVCEEELNPTSNRNAEKREKKETLLSLACLFVNLLHFTTLSVSETVQG